MKTKQNHRTSHMNMTRVLLPDGNYVCYWDAGVAGRVGEVRDYQGRLLDELNPVQIPVAPVEPLARWQVALWRWTVGFAVVGFWVVVLGVLSQ